MYQSVAEMLRIFENFLGMGQSYFPDTPMGRGHPGPYPTSFGASVLHLLMLSRPTSFNAYAHANLVCYVWLYYN